MSQIAIHVCQGFHNHGIFSKIYKHQKYEIQIICDQYVHAYALDLGHTN